MTFKGAWPWIRGAWQDGGIPRFTVIVLGLYLLAVWGMFVAFLVLSIKHLAAGS